MICITSNAIDKYIGIHYMMHSCTLLTTQRHFHDGCSEIMIVLRGQLDHEHNGSVVTMKCGDLFFLPDNSIHQLNNPSDNLIMLNLSVIPSIIEQALQFLRISDPPRQVSFSHVDQQVVDYLLWNHKRLTLADKSTDRTSIIRNTFSMLLPYCCRNKPEMDWFDSLLHEMHKQENFQGGVQRMQQLAFCTPAHLCRTCKARTGMTPTQYIDKIRIQYACNLLKHMEYSINDVCMECGYNNLGYFYRRFTQEAGMPPGQFKNRHYLKIKRLL